MNFIIYLLEFSLFILSGVYSEGNLNKPKDSNIRPRYSILKTRYTEDGSVLEDKYCSVYYPNVTSIVYSEDDVAFYNVSNAYSWDVCNEEPPLDLEIDNKYVFINISSNCSYFEQVSLVKEKGAFGVVFQKINKTYPVVNDTFMGFNIIILRNTTTLQVLAHEEDGLEMGLYTDDVDFNAFNTSLILVWILAMCTVSIGSFWSGRYRYKLWLKQLAKEAIPEPVLAPRASASGPNHNSGDDSVAIPVEEPRRREKPKPPMDEASIYVAPKLIVFFVMIMCAMLLSLYFLYDYLVYVIITLFCIASGTALYLCLYALISNLPCGDCRTPYFNIYIYKGTVEVRQIILLLFSLSMVILWVVIRKEPYSWVLQDILGIAFSINVLKTVRLSNLKIVTILLTLLFFYDIFFVFITPLFTSNGRSIMVDVAQGGSTGEQIPMVLIVPHFEYPEIDYICDRDATYNLLGFGDLLVPGLIVGFAHFFDLRQKTPFRLYFCVNMLFYGIGLIITFIGLYLMRFAQPALLYLVPCTLLPTVIIGACRGELNEMWNCDNNAKSDLTNAIEDDDGDTPSPQS